MREGNSVPFSQPSREKAAERAGFIQYAFSVDLNIPFVRFSQCGVLRLEWALHMR